MKTEFIIEPQNQDLEENKRLKVSYQAPPVPGPGCRIHFNGGLQGSINERQPYHVTNPFLTHDFGMAIGETIGGNGFDSYEGAVKKNLSELAPNAMATTFDSIVVDTTTRVMIFNPSDESIIEFDCIGPFILNNAKWGFRPSWANGAGQYEDEQGNKVDNFWKKYGINSETHFNKISIYSMSDMHGWPKGKITIDCTPGNNNSRLGRDDDGDLKNIPDDYCYKYQNGRWVPTSCKDGSGKLIPGSETPNHSEQIGLVEESESQPNPDNIVRYGISNR